MQKVVLAAVFLFLSGYVCFSYSQETEGVIMLNSPEEIEQFKKMLEEKAEYLPQKPAEHPEADSVVIPDENKNKAKDPEQNFKVYKPQAKEELAEKSTSGAGKKDISKTPYPDEDEFKVYIPQAKEENDVKNQDKEIIWLDSDEKIEQMNELLQKTVNSEEIK